MPPKSPAKGKASAASKDAPEKKEPKAFDRRDQLLRIERQVQQQWEKAGVSLADPPAPGTQEYKEQNKFFVTFPYPYMNGVLHLGHAFTLAKCEFAARFHRLLGERVLFPFGFHCTGMPIAACADKLKKEIETFGFPPQFPQEVETPKTEAKAAKPDAPKPKARGKAKIAKKKSKHKYQWDIMREMGVPESEIGQFADPMKWLGYFPPIAKDDLKLMGLSVDFRRSFITTDANKYYDAFIRWHFNTLKKRNKIEFGKRMSVFSPATGQPCADHDRASGEAVGPQEYTAIKLQLLEPYPEPLQRFSGKPVKIFLLCATLRPETMYGQTNAWVLPRGEYGAFATTNDAEIFVMSDRAALNLSYQQHTKKNGQVEKLASLTGWDLLGRAVSAPLCQHPKVYLLPLLTIKMSKGTGIVTCVPSDAPDDYQALKDLKENAKMRQQYKIEDEKVLPFDVIPIIDIPGLGTSAAARLCEERKVKNQHDRKALDEIKKQVYLEGFYKGVMTIGEHKGKRVELCKPLVRKQMIAAGTAISYVEPESTVISRHGDECVVALTDQWYLKYGEEQWKRQVEGHVASTLQTYNPQAKKMFETTIGWLHEWACSRTYGLGTRLPWDKKWVIESLSDSTIYMAFYTIAHKLQGGVLDGSGTSPAGVKPEQLTDEVFDYIFQNKDNSKPFPAACGIPKATVDSMKAEFEYWYPMDMRVSGKDLIYNHLTMSLYNHAAIWDGQPEMWPRGFYTNGHLMINKEKMSKSTGNFLTLVQSIEKYSADATRIGLANAGDSLMDANFDDGLVNASILRLTKEQTWIQETTKSLASSQAESKELRFFDRLFENAMNMCIEGAKEAYATMHFHDALRYAFFEMMNARDGYRAACNDDELRPSLLARYIEAFLIMLSPICPHYTQHVWASIGKPGFIMHAKWPRSDPVDAELTRKAIYIHELSHNLHKTLNLVGKGTKKGKKSKQPASTGPLNTLHLYVASAVPDWQQAVVGVVRREMDKTGSVPSKKDVLPLIMRDCKQFLVSGKAKKKLQQYAVETLGRAEGGAQALELTLPFDEYKLITENLQGIVGDMSMQTVKVFKTDDPNAPAFDRADTAVPGTPVPNFFNEGGAPAPSASSSKKKGGGGRGAGGGGAAMVLSTDGSGGLLSNIVAVAAGYAEVGVQIVEGKGEKATLKTPQGPISTSGAIIRYIARMRKDTGLNGDNAYQEGLVDQWLEFTANELAPTRAMLVYPLTPEGKATHDKTAAKVAATELRRLLQLVDRHLLTRTYLVGDHITVADIAVVCGLVDLVRYVVDPAFDKQFLVNLDRWFNTCVNQPAFSAVLGGVTRVAPAAEAKKGKKAQKGKKGKGKGNK